MTGSILIVARNNRHLTKKAIKSARSQENFCEIIVIDNHSNDGTSSWLHTSTKVYPIILTQQKSLAACWNLGLNILFRQNVGSPVLILNNDVEIRNDTYNLLWKVMRASGAGIVSGIESDNLKGSFDARSLLNDSSIHPSFSCFMLSADAFSRVGPFDEEYFPAYCEDLDYHVRIHRAGIKAIAVPLPFIHQGSQTLANADPAEAYLIGKAADENRKRFKEKYGVAAGSKEYYDLFI